MMSSNIRLKKNIHESLIKKVKRKKVINENFKRFKPILNKSNEKIIEDFINEISYLRNKGLSSKMINEGIGDLFSSVLGKSGTGITEYFKVKIAQWILDKLKIVDPNSFLGLALANIFAEISIAEYGKIFAGDCDLITERVSHGLVDAMAQHFMLQKGYDNALSNILLQSVSESLASIEVIQKIQNKLSGILCPLFGQVAGKVKQMGTK
jgi:hypothetical protein